MTTADVIKYFADYFDLRLRDKEDECKRVRELLKSMYVCNAPECEDACDGCILRGECKGERELLDMVRNELLNGGDTLPDKHSIGKR